MARHLAICAPAHAGPEGGPVRLFRIRTEAAGDPLYWLDVEIKADARLRDLDRFLRDVWLECCGHMSAFTISGVRYEIAAPMADWPFDPLDGPRSRSMNARLSDVVVPGLVLHYEYDFGTTTALRLKVASARDGQIGRRQLRLLARNEPATQRCAICSASAAEICTLCLDESEDIFFCKDHARAHIAGAHDEDDASLLPVVNSPRMGICGYTGPRDDRYEIRASNAQTGEDRAIPTVWQGRRWERCPRNRLRVRPWRVLRVPEGHKRAFDGQRGGGPDGKSGVSVLDGRSAGVKTEIPGEISTAGDSQQFGPTKRCEAACV